MVFGIATTPVRRSNRENIMLSFLSFLILGTVFGGVVVVAVLAVRAPEQDNRSGARSETAVRGTSDLDASKPAIKGRQGR